MKKLSIRTRIFLLFSSAMILMMIIMFILVRIISASVMKQTLSEYLISAVDSNALMLVYMTPEEVEQAKVYDADDLYLEYGDGYLQVDDDFLDILNDVESALYDAEGNLIYGNNPLSRELAGEAFTDSRIYEKKISGKEYIVYDRKFIEENLEGLWIRGTVPLSQEEIQVFRISTSMAAFLPLLIMIVILVSAFAARSILKPIRHMEETAEQIAGGEDLNRRIELPQNKDELYGLATTYNDMLDRLEASFARERQFTSDASHELRTPLAVIMAQIEYVSSKDRSVEEYKSAFDTVDRQSRRMKRLVEDMLNLSRIAQGEKRYPVTELDLSVLVQNVCQDMGLFNYKGITLDSNVTEGIMLRGNADLLERMLVNLIDNAYKYGRDNGNITVTLFINDDDKKTLTVTDNGIGIDEKSKNKIFDRFYREDSSRSGASGYGLGLSLVREIVQFHGGHISVESVVNVGSKFIIEF